MLNFFIVMAGLVPAIHVLIAERTVRRGCPRRKASEATPFFEPATRGHDEAERALQIKSRRGDHPRRLCIRVREEEIPSLAGLAATYSSKP
jgi:hypothetical protein